MAEQVRRCAECGGVIEGKRRDAVYCGASCRIKAQVR
jgi:hypothetical protein